MYYVRETPEEDPKAVSPVRGWLATKTWMSTKRLHGSCRNTGEKRLETDPLSDVALRYKRNILALSAAVLAWWYMDGITIGTINQFGITIKPETTLTIILLLLLYNGLLYVVKAISEWLSWAAEARNATFYYLRMIFGVWPDVAVLKPNMGNWAEDWCTRHEEGHEWRRELNVEERGKGPYWTFRIIRIGDDAPIFAVEAPTKRVSRAWYRIVQFFSLDVALPAVATIWAVLIIACNLVFAGTGEPTAIERNQLFKYRAHQAWPSETR